MENTNSKGIYIRTCRFNRDDIYEYKVYYNTILNSKEAREVFELNNKRHITYYENLENYTVEKIKISSQDLIKEWVFEKEDFWLFQQLFDDLISFELDSLRSKESLNSEGYNYFGRL